MTFTSIPMVLTSPKDVRDDNAYFPDIQCREQPTKSTMNFSPRSNKSRSPKKSKKKSTDATIPPPSPSSTPNKLKRKKKKQDLDSDSSSHHQTTPTTYKNNVATTFCGIKSALKKKHSNEKNVNGSKRRASIQFGGTPDDTISNDRSRLSISFAPQEAQIREVQPMSELMDNPKQLWFQSHEFDRIKCKAFEIVDKLEHRESCKNYCTRGLEHIMTQGAQTSQERKSKAWDSVLSIQQEQSQQAEDNNDNNNDNSHGTSNFANKLNDDIHERISQQYKLTTIESQQEATQRAKLDAMDVQKYLKSTRRLHQQQQQQKRFECRRSSM